MNDLPRQKLCEIITKYGSTLCDDPRRCEAFLRDFCGEYRREIFVLITALKQGITTKLLNSQNSVPQTVLLANLINRLQNDIGLTAETAQWAVASWALALGIIADVQQDYSPLKLQSQLAPNKFEQEDEYIYSKRVENFGEDEEEFEEEEEEFDDEGIEDFKEEEEENVNDFLPMPVSTAYSWGESLPPDLSPSTPTKNNNPQPRPSKGLVGFVVVGLAVWATIAAVTSQQPTVKSSTPSQSGLSATRTCTVMYLENQRVRSTPNGDSTNGWVQRGTQLTPTGKTDGVWLEISAPVQGWVATEGQQGQRLVECQ
jgi:hypothetical protein